MRLPMRTFAALVALTMAGSRASAQVRAPDIKAPVNAARAAAAKTNEQTEASGRAGEAAPQQKAAQPAPASAPKKAPATGAAKAPAKAPAAQATSVSEQGARRGSTVTVMREAFSYVRGNRRDPFVSLMASGELRPIFTDLVLTGVIYDEDGMGRASIAMLVDNSTGQSYSVRIGQTLGRMRVAKIGRESITFDIDEFGLRRSETLDIEKTKAGAPAPRRP